MDEDYIVGSQQLNRKQISKPGWKTQLETRQEKSMTAAQDPKQPLAQRGQVGKFGEIGKVSKRSNACIFLLRVRVFVSFYEDWAIELGASK